MRAEGYSGRGRRKPLSTAALAAVVVLAVAPAAAGLVYNLCAGFGYFRAQGPSGFTVAYYRALWDSGDGIASLSVTLAFAAVGTLLSYIAALALALALRSSSGLTRWSRFLLRMPLPVPHLVVGLFTFLFLSQSGLISRLLVVWGVLPGMPAFPELVYDRFGVGILLAYLWKEVPYLTIVILAILAANGSRYEAVAQSLGATKGQRLRWVIVPLVSRGALPALLLLFTFLFGAFEVPLLLGRTYPPMLSVLTFQRLTQANTDGRGEAFAVGTVIAALTILLMVIYRRLERTGRAA